MIVVVVSSSSLVVEGVECHRPSVVGSDSMVVETDTLG